MRSALAILQTASTVPGALPTTVGGWRCIVADPPWSFRDKGSRIAPDQKRKRLARKGYGTMALEEIAALPVGAVAAKDALLLLWTTSAHLVDGSARRVAQAWGFEPKVTLVWVKARPRLGREAFAGSWPVLAVGMGHYVRGAHELVVLATRGRPAVNDHSIPSVFFAPRGAHSSKPDELQAIAERLVDGPRLELFARRERPGWTAWGDQVGNAGRVQCG